MTGTVRTAVMCAAMLAGTVPVFAQTPPRVEVTVGAVATASASAGDVDATLLDPGGSPLTLFRTSNRVTSGVGATAQVGLRVSPRAFVELGGGWMKTNLQTRVTSDFENAGSVSATQGVNQFTVDLSAQYAFARRGKLVPFVRVGAGWLRELTSDRALVENGLCANLGGGIKYWVRESSPGLFGRLALRAEVRLAALHGGIAFGDRSTRLTPTFAAGLLFGR